MKTAAGWIRYTAVTTAMVTAIIGALCAALTLPLL